MNAQLDIRGPDCGDLFGSSRAGLPWTLADDEFLRRHYRQGGGHAIARRLGRTKVGVYLRAYSLGLTSRRGRGRRYDPAFVVRVASLFAAGDTLAAISRQTGADRATIRTVLAAQFPDFEGRLRRQARAALRNHAKALAAAGDESASRFWVRHAAARRIALRYGLPGLSVRELVIVLAMADGPLTTAQLAGRFGVVRTACAGPLNTLRRRGLVTSVGMRIGPTGRGRKLWSLTAKCMDILASTGGA